MVDTKKEQEREELHRAIWAIADDLRGAVDGWDFKSYVLGTMFYRYISENIASYINQGEIDAGNPDCPSEELPFADSSMCRKTVSSVSLRFSSLAAFARTLQNSSLGRMKNPFSCTSPSRACSASASGISS